jgi:hypothetical protein
MIFLSCYDLIRHDCTGSCQGCSDCPMATQYLYSVPVTRWDVIKFVLDTQYVQWKLNRLIKKNPDFLKNIKRHNQSTRI